MPAVLRVLGERALHARDSRLPWPTTSTAFSLGGLAAAATAARGDVVRATCALRRCLVLVLVARRGLRAGARAHAPRGQRRLERRRGAATSWRAARDRRRRRARSRGAATRPRRRRRAAVARRRARARDDAATGASPRPSASVDAAAARVRDTRGRLLPDHDRLGPLHVVQRSALRNAVAPVRPAASPSARPIRASSSASSSSGRLNGDHRRCRSTSPASSGRRSPPRRPAIAASARAPGRPRSTQQVGRDPRLLRPARGAAAARASSSRTSRSTASSSRTRRAASTPAGSPRTSCWSCRWRCRTASSELRQRDLAIDRARWTLNEAIGRPVDAPTARRRRRRASRRCRRSTSAARRLREQPGAARAASRSSNGSRTPRRALARSRLPRFEGGGADRLDQRRRSSQPQRRSARASSASPGTSAPTAGARRSSPRRASRPSSNRLAIERELRELESAVRDTRDAAAERLAALDTARAAVGQAEENLRIRQQQFDAGRATSEDVLDAQAPAHAAARDARDRALPGPHPPRRAAGADGPAARRRWRRHEVSRMSQTHSDRRRRARRWSRGAVWWLRARPRSGPLHGLRRGRGARRCAARSPGACSRSRSREGDPVPAGAVVARLDDRDIARADRVEARRDRACIDAEIRAPGGAGRAHRDAPGSATSSAQRGRGARRRRPARDARASARSRASRSWCGRAPAPRSCSTTARAGATRRASALDRAREMLGARRRPRSAASTLARQQLEVLRAAARAAPRRSSPSSR